MAGTVRHHLMFTSITLMTAGLAMTIALVLLSILALEQPFAGITRVEPDAADSASPIRRQSPVLTGL
jgi:Na+-transporting methylmalonyl-CoA/oxaloacetate decarboxylase gamma subunit